MITPTLHTLDAAGFALAQRKRESLLADVANTIMASGYAYLPQTQPKRRYSKRGAAILKISQDNRIHSRSNYTRAALIDEVMARYKVSRANAKKLIYLARKHAAL